MDGRIYPGFSCMLITTLKSAVDASKGLRAEFVPQQQRNTAYANIHIHFHVSLYQSWLYLHLSLNKRLEKAFVMNTLIFKHLNSLQYKLHILTDCSGVNF